MIDPDRLLDDDGNIDPAALASRKQDGLSASACAALRLDMTGTDKTTQSIADDVLPVYSRSTIGKHITGECAHDVDVPPVKRVCRWESVEDYHG
jgi:hypothetical protein